MPRQVIDSRPNRVRLAFLIYASGILPGRLADKRDNDSLLDGLASRSLRSSSTRSSMRSGSEISVESASSIGGKSSQGLRHIMAATSIEAPWQDTQGGSSGEVDGRGKAAAADSSATTAPDDSSAAIDGKPEVVKGSTTGPEDPRTGATAAGAAESTDNEATHV